MRLRLGTQMQIDILHKPQSKEHLLHHRPCQWCHLLFVHERRILLSLVLPGVHHCEVALYYQNPGRSGLLCCVCFAYRDQSYCLFVDTTLALRPPYIDGTEVTQGLVWGARSSVCSCGVHLATHPGYEFVGVET